ncbi:polysaccharide biosynthesis tyrosine autokinase [Parvibaculum sp.]|uniref:GumC family protein n=1 Tax=Parvibaculum sp. TaxID=2024848 RepID=UPI002BC83F2D|nr:polysaccharide biosynthesis tyrosine autokinase [Parvibaculum sp.]HUD53101.1 polysaccharide biosynthesis tyrosine autokinase [Parvibaculum sp.]
MTLSNQLPSAPGFGNSRQVEPVVPGFSIPPASESDAMAMLRKLWRGKIFIIGTVGTLLIVSFVATSLMTPLFMATSEVLIGVPGSNVAGAQSSVDKLVVDRDTVESQGHVIASRATAERVVERLALDHDPEFNPALRPESLLAGIKGLFKFSSETSSDETASDEKKEQARQRVISTVLNAVSVDAADRSHVLEVSATSQSPAKAMRIANAFADLYIEQQLIFKAQTTQKANEWLSAQIQTLRAQVDNDERAVEDYRRANNLYEANNATVTTQQMSELSTQLVTAEAAKAEADAQLGQATAMLKAGKDPKSIPQVLASPIIQALEEKRTDVEQQAAQLSSIYGPKHPQIQNIKAQIADINAKERAQVAQIVASLKNEQTAAQARYNALKASLDRTQGAVGQTNEQSIKLRELEREAQASSTLFQNFLEGYKQTAAQQDFQQPDAWVISHASMPNKAAFPPTAAIFVGAGLAGLIGGALLALFADSLDRSFRTSEDVERRTGLPTLAMIPTFRASAAAEHVIRDPASPFSEAVRKLHTKLVLTHPGESPSVIMMTSSIPDEGKSLISISMARLLAYSGRRVIVVDGDLRRPSLHSLLGQPSQPGLVELLNGEATPDEAVYRDPTSGLHAIFAGRVPHGTGYVPDFERLRALLSSLSRHYELVILDTPPVLVGSEAMQYARIVDATVFVARWRHTSQDVAADAIKQVRMSGGHISGVALAQVDPKLYKRYASVDLHYTYTNAKRGGGKALATKVA